QRRARRNRHADRRMRAGRAGRHRHLLRRVAAAASRALPGATGRRRFRTEIKTGSESLFRFGLASLVKPASNLNKDSDPIFMAKAKTAYVCGECGASYNKWQGQCGECGAWNTLSEFVVEPASASAGPKARMAGYAGAVDPPKITPLKAVSQDA